MSKLQRPPAEHPIWPVLVSGLVFLPLLLLYFWTRTPSVTSAFGSVDGGELAAAVVAAGVPHPPGYPTYLLWSRIALALPAGEAAARLALGSGIATALAATVLALLIHSLGSASPVVLRCSVAVGAGWLLGIDPFIWQQAIVVEVYGLALLFGALLLWLAARWRRWRQRSTVVAGGLVFGLGLGVQLPLLAFGAGAALVLIWQCIQGKSSWRAAGGAAGLGILAACCGMGVYGLLPVLGNAHPAASWGDWRTFEGGLRHITAQEYHYLAGAVPWTDRIGRIGYASRELLTGLGPWGVALALAGLIAPAPASQSWRLLTGGLAGLTLLWAISYGGADSTSYLLPLHLVGALWAGMGGLALAESFARRHPWLLASPLLLLALLPGRLSALSLSQNTVARDRGLAWLSAAPPQALILTARDEETFPLWYLQTVSQLRPDVQVVDGRLWINQWYRQRFRCAAATPQLAQALQACAQPILATPLAHQLVPTWPITPIPNSELVIISPLQE